MKLGQGGIREIEFFTQTRQLIAGGRDPDLRGNTTVGGLAMLAAKGWVPAGVAEELTALYRQHREVEHRLQMVNDAQTHTMPVTAEGVARIAAFCGQGEADFRAGLLERLKRTDALTEGFFSPSAQDGAEDPAVALSENAQAIVARWPKYPAFRTDRAQALFRRIRPQVLKHLHRSAHPDEAVSALDGFFAGLPAGVQIFALFDANPSLIELIVDIASTSPQLARYLSRNAAVLDAVIGGSFWAAWPGLTKLREDLAQVLAGVADYEGKLIAARRWMKEWHFRVGVHHLRGLVDAFEAAKSYADLAEAVLGAIWPATVADFARRFGPPPGRGAIVLGMGSLGAARLNAESDLDLIVIYDAQGQEMSEGPKSLATRPYYARLTQSLVTALTAQMPDGRLYEVDMRLRPSGRQGPVATSWQSFTAYQMDEAWTWEHLALTRARVLVGDPEMAAAFEAFRREVLAQKGQGAGVRADVSRMRDRLSEAKPPRGTWEAKNGPGRLMDIELAAQTFALISAAPARTVERQIASAKRCGVSESDQQVLLDTYRLMWRMQCASRLLTEGALDMDAIGEGGRDFLLRETGATTASELSERLDRAVEAAEAVINAQIRDQE